MVRVLPIVLVLALSLFSASASSCEWGERECQALSGSQAGCEGEVPQLSQAGLGIDASLPQRRIGVGGRMALAIGIVISSASESVESSETT
jgi:hypothetical protein